MGGGHAKSKFGAEYMLRVQGIDFVMRVYGLSKPFLGSWHDIEKLRNPTDSRFTPDKLRSLRASSSQLRDC